MRKACNFTYTLAAIFAVIVLFISSLWGGGYGVVYAATSITTQFEQSDIMDDLNSATINGKKFSVLNYPYDSTGLIKHPEILTVVEYCYSIRPAQRGNYGIYVYFYNPQALNIKTDSAANKITMGVKYSTDKDGFTKVDDYEKFDLQFCSKSSGDYRDLFYKFKVVDHRSSVDGLTIEQRVNSNERRYDISEVELFTYGDTNATAYTVGGTFKFTGYAAGYGADINAESTLAMSAVENLETIELDIAGVKDGIDKRTYWRSNSSSLGAHHQNQINSVFFAIDTSVLEKFGYTLQKIKAEWWEYKTAPAIVVENDKFVEDLLTFAGLTIGESYDSSRMYSIYNCVKEAIGSGIVTQYHYYYSSCWNVEQVSKVSDGIVTYSDFLNALLFVFSSGDISVDEYVLSAEKLQTYCKAYDKSYDKGHLKINEHDFSADLFTDEVDEGRTRGYNLREFDITNPDDYWDIRSYDSTHNWWQKFKDYGFGTITTNDDYRDISPIQMLEAEDFAVSNVSDHLKINSDDVGKLKDYYNACVKDNNNDGKPDNAVFLFRYAQTDFFAHDLTVKELSTGNTSSGELRQGTQFFDFDILTMTFNKAGKLTTLGVASSPVDHWSDYTPSIEAKDPDWWSRIMQWLKRVGKYILSFVLFVICIVILFKVFGWLIDRIGNLFNKKE